MLHSCRCRSVDGMHGHEPFRKCRQVQSQRSRYIDAMQTLFHNKPLLRSWTGRTKTPACTVSAPRTGKTRRSRSITHATRRHGKMQATSARRHLGLYNIVLACSNMHLRVVGTPNPDLLIDSRAVEAVIRSGRISLIHHHEISVELNSNSAHHMPLDEHCKITRDLAAWEELRTGSTNHGLPCAMS